MYALSVRVARMAPIAPEGCLFHGGLPGKNRRGCDGPAAGGDLPATRRRSAFALRSREVHGMRAPIAYRRLNWDPRWGVASAGEVEPASRRSATSRHGWTWCMAMSGCAGGAARVVEPACLAARQIHSTSTRPLCAAPGPSAREACLGGGYNE